MKLEDLIMEKQMNAYKKMWYSKTVEKEKTYNQSLKFLISRFTPEEILNKLDIKDIEQFIRKQKLKKINK